jgi:hypothetical protein
MNKRLNDILFLFPVMLYYAFEALIVGIFITIVWKLCLSQFFGNIGYLQIVGIYWIVKMLLFDVFKLITGLQSLGNNAQQEMKEDIKNHDNTENQ